MCRKTIIQTVESGITNFLQNRNPRNLERLRIGYKPSGYFLDKPGRNFWHKVELEHTGRHVTARVVHFENGPVIEASTSEWAIKKQLYRCKDTCAYINLGRILADRCLKFGIIEMYNGVLAKPDTKVEKFLTSLKSGGVNLEETDRLRAQRPWDKHRYEKPWEVQEQI